MKFFSAQERRILLIIILAAFGLRAGLALRAEFQLPTRPFIEDAFYSMTVARHLALGDGFTADCVHPTNGVQPLIVLIYAPLFKFVHAERWPAIRLTYLAQSLIDCCSIFLIALLIKKLRSKKNKDEEIDKKWWQSPAIWAALIWAFSYSIFVHTMNGLETGLYSMLLLVVFIVYHELRTEPSKSIGRWIVLGVLLGLTVLTRIDAVFFVIVLFGIEILHEKRIKQAIVLSLTALIVSSPWWIYNYTQFGSLMPVSGQAEAMGPDYRENLLHGGMALADVFSTFFYPPYFGMPVWLDLFWMAFVAALLIYIIRRTNVVQRIKTEYNVQSLHAWWIAGGALIIYYVFFFSAPHFLARYYQPFRIWWTVIASIAIPVLIDQTALWRKEHLVVSRSLVAVLSVAAIAFSFSRLIYNFTVSTPTELYLAGNWANQRPSQLVGMDQSGTTGFMAPNVVNLDGKVNPDALLARKQMKMGAYIANRKFDYIADWAQFAKELVDDAARFGVHYQPIDTLGKIVIWQRI